MIRVSRDPVTGELSGPTCGCHCLMVCPKHDLTEAETQSLMDTIEWTKSSWLGRLYWRLFGPVVF